MEDERLPHLLTASATPTGSSPTGDHPAFRDGPPARVTGGFGEDSCFACHWDGTENDGVGRLQVSGFPEEYEPGVDYELGISLRHPELVVAGFQLAVRTRDGEAQAGALGLPDPDEGRVAILVDREVEFAHHTVSGTEPVENAAARWSLQWTAPETGSGTALLHISAVAGDGDDSQMGDAVYTLELESRRQDSP